ncbi:hypothetical protein ACR0ST_00405 [Aliidiomarina sp. Khilg15.8]
MQIIGEQTAVKLGKAFLGDLITDQKLGTQTTHADKVCIEQAFDTCAQSTELLQCRKASGFCTVLAISLDHLKQQQLQNQENRKQQYP